METTRIHGLFRFWILHESLPNKTGAEIFCHQYSYAEIDPQHIRVIPKLTWVEGVTEAISAPGVSSISGLKRTKNTDAVDRQKWK